MVTELSKKIKISEDDSGNDIASYFPALLWIIRDFHLELVDEEGTPITNDQYLESALEEQRGFSKEIMERNNIRKLLTAFFKERHCFTMVRPTQEEKDLQTLSSNVGKIRGIFEKQLQELRNMIFNSIKPKSVDGMPMIGSTYLGFVSKIVDAINKGAVIVKIK